MNDERLKPAKVQFEIDSQFEHWGCPYCGKAESVPYKNAKLSKGLNYVQCAVCTLVYPFPRLNNKALDERARNHYKGYKPSGINILNAASDDRDMIYSRYRWDLDFINPFINIRETRGIKILEVGCAEGDFAEGLKFLGNDVAVVEPDPTMADISRARGVSVVQELFKPGIPLTMGQFDLVIFRESLYHFFDVKQTIALAKDLLTSEGYIYIKIFNAESLAIRNFAEASSGINGIDIPANFSPKSLRYVLEDSGFTVFNLRGIVESPVGGYAIVWKFARSRIFKIPRGFLNRVWSYPLIMTNKSRNFAVIAQKNNLS